MAHGESHGASTLKSLMGYAEMKGRVCAADELTNPCIKYPDGGTAIAKQRQSGNHCGRRQGPTG